MITHYSSYMWLCILTALYIAVIKSTQILQNFDAPTHMACWGPTWNILSCRDVIGIYTQVYFRACTCVHMAYLDIYSIHEHAYVIYARSYVQYVE